MSEIIYFIKNLYAIDLNESQVKELIEWFNSEYEETNDEKFSGALEEYLSKKYGPILLLEEDSSNIKYLLAILKDNKKK